MSLFGSLQIASNALRTTQVGLQVVGQNISNANTPGYIREEVNYAPAPAQQIGSLQLGLGVQIDGIVQKVDDLLEQRLRLANSDLSNSETQEQTFQQLEALNDALGDRGLGKTLSDFFGSINDVLNQPESASTRNLTVLKGQTLASDINRLNSRANEIRDDLDNQIASGVTDVNRLTQSIAKLNVQIANVEGSSSLKSPAVGLRDQRALALSELSKLVNINVQEQSDGTVAVYTGGDFLVFGDETRQLKILEKGGGLQIRLADNNSQLQLTGGKLLGLVASRDQVIGGFQERLDDFAKTLAFEFNKVHASGQGLNGYQQPTSELAVDDATHALDMAGLPNPPVNGSFQLQLHNTKTGLTTSTNITIDLDGLDHDTTLNDLVTQINAIDGITASIDPTGHLVLKNNTADQEIAFANDTSGVLAALGVNTFFTGSSAATIGVNQALVDDPSKLAASRGGVGADTAGAVELAGFIDRPLPTRNNNNIAQLHDQIIADITQGSAQAHSVAEGFRTFQGSLQGQSMSVSSVNIDEEAIKLVTLQRTYQASARFITTINDLLETLVNL